MSTLANAEIRAASLERLARLKPLSSRRWGKMTPHEMVCHLNDSFESMAGKKYVSPATGPFHRTILKWIALRAPLRWPPGVPTRPEMQQGKGGTPPTEWSSDVALLSSWITQFAEVRTFAPHPIFGPLTREEILIWGYRHVDHHLRQFGV